MSANEMTVAVVGLGYVGLPLAVAFGRQFRTLGYDLDEAKVEAYRRHVDPTGEVTTQELRAASGLECTSDPRRLAEADFPSQVAGFRYFNVYGPREQHKDRMASVAFHFFNQYQAEGKVRLFEGCDGYGNGEQRRDFVFIDDVVKVNLHFLDSGASGIYNLGTGRAQSFNDVAVATVNACRAAQGEAPLTLADLRSRGVIEYIAFPEALKGKYQSYTEADVSLLRQAGYEAPFATVEEGVAQYVNSRIGS